MKKPEINVREVFKKGKESKNPVIRGATKIAEFFWNSGLILGAAVSKAEPPQTRK